MAFSIVSSSELRSQVYPYHFKLCFLVIFKFFTSLQQQSCSDVYHNHKQRWPNKRHWNTEPTCYQTGVLDFSYWAPHILLMPDSLIVCGQGHCSSFFADWLLGSQHHRWWVNKMRTKPITSSIRNLRCKVEWRKPTGTPSSGMDAKVELWFRSSSAYTSDFHQFPRNELEINRFLNINHDEIRSYQT